jgi:hypothetical protein
MRGRRTIERVARETGYTWHQISRAVSELKLRPVKTGSSPRGRRTLLSAYDVERVLAHLGQETADEERTTVHVREVVRLTGRPLRTVYHRARRMGLAVRNGRLARGDASRLRTELLVPGAAVARAARMVGHPVKPELVDAWLCGEAPAPAWLVWALAAHCGLEVSTVARELHRLVGSREQPEGDQDGEQP